MTLGCASCSGTAPWAATVPLFFLTGGAWRIGGHRVMVSYQGNRRRVLRGRRNLTPDQRSILRGRRYNRTKRKAEDNLKRGTVAPSGQSVRSENTAETLAAQYGVTERTIRRHLTDDQKAAIQMEFAEAVAAEGRRAKAEGQKRGGETAGRSRPKQDPDSLKTERSTSYPPAPKHVTREKLAKQAGAVVTSSKLPVSGLAQASGRTCPCPQVSTGWPSCLRPERGSPRTSGRALRLRSRHFASA